MWKHIKYDIESYCLMGSCHSYAPTFQLTLARLVEPEEKWMVRTSDTHTTVINESKTKVFDLLYWAALGNLDKYLFGKDVVPNDETLGGKQAYIDSHIEKSMDVISFEQFKHKLETEEIKIKILNDYIGCYPKNTLIKVKTNNGTYLTEIILHKSTGEILPPKY